MPPCVPLPGVRCMVSLVPCQGRGTALRDPPSAGGTQVGAFRKKNSWKTEQPEVRRQVRGRLQRGNGRQGERSGERRTRRGQAPNLTCSTEPKGQWQAKDEEGKAINSSLWAEELSETQGRSFWFSGRGLKWL